MKKLLVFCLLPGAFLLAKVEERDTFRQTYGYSSRLEVRNINGAIRVTGTNGNNIEFVANRRIEAKNQEALELAKREVRLDIQSSGDRLRVCIAEPYRDCNDERGNRGCRGDCERDYSVRYDFELQVPRAIAVDLKSVNGGVWAKAVNGAFNVSTVNGGVTLEDMGSSGSATTVNGGVKLSFINVPAESVKAKTVNGTIDAAFPKNLHANIRFKTFNGDVFTSFPATAMANLPAETERRDGRTIIRSNRSFGISIGGGGPEHHFETLNGAIQIAER